MARGPKFTPCSSDKPSLCGSGQPFNDPPGSAFPKARCPLGLAKRKEVPDVTNKTLRSKFCFPLQQWSYIDLKSGFFFLLFFLPSLLPFYSFCKGEENSRQMTQSYKYPKNIQLSLHKYKQNLTACHMVFRKYIFTLRGASVHAIWVLLGLFSKFMNLKTFSQL